MPTIHKKNGHFSRDNIIYMEREFYIFNNSDQKSLQIGIRRLLTGAGDENRTHNRSLGSSYFATKLRPLMQLTSYILLYFLPFDKHFNAFFENLYSFCIVFDLNHTRKPDMLLRFFASSMPAKNNTCRHAAAITGDGIKMLYTRSRFYDI